MVWFERQLGAEHYGTEQGWAAKVKAEQIIAQELKRRRWKPADLKTRRRGDPIKVALPARLRTETTLTVEWIAERVAMGTRGYLDHLIYRHRKTRK